MNAVDFILLCGAFLVVFFLELVLVVDNALVIILMCGGLPLEKRGRAQRLAILQGAILRVVLIGFIGYISQLLVPVPYVSKWMQSLNGHEFTLKSGISLVGGLVLVAMAAHHIHKEWKTVEEVAISQVKSIGQVLLKTFGVSLIFSIDSVMSAVGMVDSLWVAGGAVFCSAIVMVVFVDQVSSMLAKYPDLKSLGLAFVLYIGGILVAEGCGYHIPKALIYLPLGFALFVQLIDILRDNKERSRDPAKTGRLRGQISTEEVRARRS